MVQEALRGIAAFIEQNDGFTIIAHTSPDGDTLGSCLALYHGLLRLGKRAQVVCGQPVPRVYAFLPGAGDVCLPEDAGRMDCAIAVDCADHARMGTAGCLFDGAKETCNIDHHGTNKRYAAHNAVDADAAAAGELVAALLRLLAVELDGAAATCLYTALMTDTGNFAYNNTRPETHRLAAELLAGGADNTEINRLVYRTVPFAKQKLLGRALGNMELLAGGRLCITCLLAGDFAETGALAEDSEGVVEHLRDVEGVEIAAFIREQEPGIFKVSLRSKQAADVSAAAERMNGGGHRHAAGGTLRGTPDAVFGEVAALCESALREVWKES